MDMIGWNRDAGRSIRRYRREQRSRAAKAEQTLLQHFLLPEDGTEGPPPISHRAQASSNDWRRWSKRDIAFIHGWSAQGVREPHGGRGFNGRPGPRGTRSCSGALRRVGFGLELVEVTCCRRGSSWDSSKMDRPANPAMRAGTSPIEGDPSSPAAAPPTAAHQMSSVCRKAWLNARPPENPALVPPHLWADWRPTRRADVGCRAKNSGVADQLKAMGPTMAKLSQALRAASV